MALSILIFDSGVGGLSVFESVKSHLPNASYTYLFDNECFPYGELAESQLIERVLAILSKAITQVKPNIIVIACNSASTLALPALRQQFSIPIVGVVPAIKPAAAITKNGVIGLLATPGTVMRSYTLALIEDFACDKLVLPIGDSALVKMAEDKMKGEVVDSGKLEEILGSWKAFEKKPDTVVLGCTHFPLIKEELANILGSKIQFVDSGDAIGRRVAALAEGMVESERQLEAQKSRVWCTRLDNTIAQLETSFRDYGFSNINQL